MVRLCRKIMENNHSITFDAPPSANVRVYEYGVRLDSSAQQAVIDQIMMARYAYNEIIACMRQVVDELPECAKSPGVQAEDE